MPRPSRRSRSLRRVFRKVTKGVKQVYVKRNAKKPVCSNCGVLLKGLSVGNSKIKSKPKSQKRPERMFGGSLCSKCSRREIIKRNRE